MNKKYLDRLQHILAAFIAVFCIFLPGVWIYNWSMEVSISIPELLPMYIPELAVAALSLIMLALLYLFKARSLVKQGFVVLVVLGPFLEWLIVGPSDASLINSLLFVFMAGLIHQREMLEKKG